MLRCSVRTLHTLHASSLLSLALNYRFHRLLCQRAREIVEGICSLTFVTFVKAHSPSGDADDEGDDDPEQQAEAEDDPVEYAKRARVLRGRVRPRDLSIASKFKSFDHRAGFQALAEVCETIRVALDGATFSESPGTQLKDYAPPSVRNSSTLGWFRVRTRYPYSTHLCAVPLTLPICFAQRSIADGTGPTTGQPGIAQILVHMCLFTGAAAKYQLQNPLPRDSDAARLTEKLVNDEKCFRVGDVSKLGLLVFGDVPITRIIKDNWVSTYTNISSSLKKVLYETVRSVRVLRSPCVLLRSGGVRVPIAPPSLIRFPYNQP